MPKLRAVSSPVKTRVGRHIRLLRQKDWCTIIGIAADVRAYDLQRSVPHVDRWHDVRPLWAVSDTSKKASVPAENDSQAVRSTANQYGSGRIPPQTCLLVE